MKSNSLKIVWLNRTVYWAKEGLEDDNSFRHTLENVVYCLTPEFKAFSDELEMKLEGCPHPKIKGHRKVFSPVNLIVP